MLIYGVHACKSALDSGRKIFRIYVLEGKKVPDWLSGRRVTFVKDFDKLVPDGGVHQGMAMEVEDVCYSDITMLADAPANCMVSILDGVTDPHNMGAIIRSAACFGVLAIIISERASCKINETVAKVASGGLEHLSIIVVKNLSQAIRTLRNYGFWITSFSERGDKYLDEVDLKGKTCLIFGAEGTGVRRLQLEESDFIVKLPTCPEFPTLNVSASAAVAFYETARQTGF